MEIRQIDVDGLSFDQQNLVLLRRNDSGDKQSTKLDSLTANLLCCFLDNPDTVLSREQLIEQVWANRHTSDNAVNRSVSVLRKALGPNDKQYISTISKVGYRFNAHKIPLKIPNPEHQL
jgi:DNA-binding winged helix-turn-helix (wHTH) protein